MLGLHPRTFRSTEVEKAVGLMAVAGREVDLVEHQAEE